MVSVFKYENPNTFLKDRWHELHKKNPSFSLRAWSKRLGFKNPTPLSLMMSDQRNIPKKHIASFIKDLNLDSLEGQFFETLIDLRRAKTPNAKERYYNHLKSISPGHQLDIAEMEEFKFLQDPLHTFILEMTSLKDFLANPAWIQSRLRNWHTLSELSLTLDRLKQLELIKEAGPGLIAKSQAHITNKPDIGDSAAQEYHRRISELAAHCVKDQDIYEREFSSFSMNIEKSKIPHAKKGCESSSKNLSLKLKLPQIPVKKPINLMSSFLALRNKRIHYETFLPFPVIFLFQ